jgi:hypothetical protein
MAVNAKSALFLRCFREFCTIYSFARILTLAVDFSISLQAFEQSRQALAHAFMCSSAGCFSQAAAHASQPLAQPSHAGPIKAPSRDMIFAAIAHKSPQSTQDFKVATCSFLPSATSPVQ